MNPLAEKIYTHSPASLQHAFTTLYGWKLARLRYGGDFRKYLEELNRSQFYSEADLAVYQNEQFRALIAHCYENVPYYSKLFCTLKLTVQEFRTTADLAKLPTLAKETVRQQTDSFYARNYLGRPSEIVGTSGTTGTTLRIRVDREGRRKNYAFFTRFKNWAGATQKTRSATFGGRVIVAPGQQSPPFWRYNLANNNLLFSSYHLAAKNLPAYVQRLRKWDPELLEGYPSSLYAIAQYMLQTGLEGPKPRVVITSSETLSTEQRDTLLRAFGAPVFDQYGSAEQVCFVSQCEQGSYHIHPEYGVVELLPADGAEMRRIIATGFTNWAMPLLRYETGDLAIPANGQCPCQRKFPMLQAVVGRVDDTLMGRDGRRVGRLDPVFKGLGTIRRAQIVQESPTVIRLIVAPGAGFSPGDVDTIRHELQNRLGPGMEYLCEVVDDIPVGPGGKFRAVINRVTTREPARSEFSTDSRT